VVGRVIGEIERVEERAQYECVDVILFKSKSLSWSGSEGVVGTNESWKVSYR